MIPLGVMTLKWEIAALGIYEFRNMRLGGPNPPFYELFAAHGRPYGGPPFSTRVAHPLRFAGFGIASVQIRRLGVCCRTALGGMVPPPRPLSGRAAAVNMFLLSLGGPVPPVTCAIRP